MEPELQELIDNSRLMSISEILERTKEMKNPFVIFSLQKGTDAVHTCKDMNQFRELKRVSRSDGNNKTLYVLSITDMTDILDGLKRS